MSSRAWRGKDPAKIKEDAQRFEQFKTAEKIFKLPETEWPQKLELLPADWRANVSADLQMLKEHRRCNR